MSDFTLDVGLAAKLKQAFSRNGWTERRVDEICGGDKLGRILRFVENGYQFSTKGTKGPPALVIDRSRPFDPATFIGKGWTVEGQDERSLALTEIDFSTVSFVSGLSGNERQINGDVKLERLKAQTAIRLDAKVGQALYEEEGQVTLRLIHEHLKISWFELAGTVVRHPYGHRHFLDLTRRDDGSWYCDSYWLGYSRGTQPVSPVVGS